MAVAPHGVAGGQDTEAPASLFSPDVPCLSLAQPALLSLPPALSHEQKLTQSSNGVRYILAEVGGAQDLLQLVPR